MVVDLSLDDFKKMPPKRQALIIGFFYLLLSAAYYVTFLQASFEKKVSLQTKLAEIQKQVMEKEILAVAKNRHAQELKERQELLRMALTKLPDERDIPELLHAVAQAGRDSGIDFILFEPKQSAKNPSGKDIKSTDKKFQDTKKEAKPESRGSYTTLTDENFYEEIPFRIQVNGSFQNTVLFFEKVARLSRIINIEEISMSEAKDAKGKGRFINTFCVIKTYMFLEKMSGKKDDDKK